MSSTYIQLPSGDIIDVEKIVAFSQTGDRVKFECVNNITKYGMYDSEEEAALGFALYKTIIFGTAAAVAITMQYIEDIYDVPQSDPPDITKPARYKQIGYAVFWEWSIAESKWYPIVAA
jgi:hypothetical protein